MPTYTRYYRLAAFRRGDIYSSRVDQRRFTIIDNELAFISDTIGSGLILGWDITDNEDGTVSISQGMGQINRRVVQSFGGFEVTLSNNSIHYLSIEARSGIVGGTSGNSNMVSDVAVDTIAPSPPSGLQQVTSIVDYLASLSSYDDDLINYLRSILNRGREEESIELVGYKEIAFRWNANTEVDFSHYKIYRLDGSDSKVLGTTTELIYADINLEQNTSYRYQVTAVDLSGNEMGVTETDPSGYNYSGIIISTDVDNRVPASPVFVQAFPGDETVEVVWDNSPTDNIFSYRVSIQELNADYETVGSPSVTDIDEDSEFGSTYAIFENLDNNTNYNITVFSLSNSGILSDGITVGTKLENLNRAGEVNDISVDFPISSFENVGLETEVLWGYKQTDPYLLFADRFSITFIENGTRVSEPIEVLEQESLQSVSGQERAYKLDVKYIPYEIEGVIKHESIKEYTPYIIIIKTIDEDENYSNGVLIRVNRTPISELVSAISNFNIERQTDNSLFLTWANPTEFYFSHNIITVNIIDITTGDELGENYVENLRIDKSDTFVIPSSEFSVDFRYHIEIISWDIFNQQGNGFELVEQFLAEEDIIRPSFPTGLNLRTGDTELYLQWDKDTKDQDIQNYKIYRAEFSYYLRSSSFQLIATLLSSLTNFTDYTVVNGTSYTYMVTAVDINSVESLNPVDDGHIGINSVSGTASSSTSLGLVEGLIISYVDNNPDATLSWDVSTGVFDGYEILRSDGNSYSFNVVGYAPVSDLSYIDENALLVDGETYYYLVRKYKDDVVLNVKSSSVLNVNSISIGVVTTSNGVNSVDIDLSSVVNLENLEDPLTDRTNAAIDLHHHRNDGGVDKRIELRSNVHVSDWTTLNYQEYITKEDMEGAIKYYLIISGEINEEYFKDSKGNINESLLRKAQAGESPVLFEVDDENKKIIFNEALYSSQETFVAPYIEAPSLVLELVGISEVDNLLPEGKVENVSASQFGSGVFDATQMPDINHDGRKGERLLPSLLPMISSDNFVYNLSFVYGDADRNVIGTAVAFYDIILVSGERLLAATSSGVWLSDDYGNEWTQTATFPVAVIRVYKSSNDEYYAITNYGVYKNDGNSFRTWVLMSGLEYVKAIRDIVEDSDGNLYVSTDLGVFKLNSEFIPYIEDTWQKTPIFGSSSTEAYALISQEGYSDGSNEVVSNLLVSNELGLLRSLDNGLSWSYISNLEALVKVRNFIIDNNYIFALSDNAIYRQGILENIFVKIADIDATVCRKIVIFKGHIYISTNNGTQISTASNIYTDDDMVFISTLSGMNIKNNVIIATTINLINDDLFVGTDRRLYVMNDEEKFWLQYDQKETVIPGIYIDGELQKLGFYYNNQGNSHNISFDEIIGEEGIVKVANKYNIYQMEFGGWAYNKYNAKFKVYRGDLLFAESRDDIVLSVDTFVNLVLPVYTDDNAHKIGADQYKALLEADLEIITGAFLPEGEDLVSLISDTYQQFELFLSQLYEDARVITDSDGNVSNFVLPAINTDLIVKRTSTSNAGEIVKIEEPVYTVVNNERGTSYTASVNIVDGSFMFDLPFDKYDLLTTDIFDITVKNVGENSHREVEDVFEEAYSGPPSYLSQVQQVNIVKMGLFVEKLYPGEQTDINPLLQMETLLPEEGDDWYDSLNSTINYIEEITYDDVSLSIWYPSAVLYVSETESVLVGGEGGVLSIEKNTLEIEELGIEGIGDKLVKSIFRHNDNIFVLTENKIFISDDYGVIWTEYSRSGLPNNLYSMGSIAGSLIVGAIDGVYIKMSDSDAISWEKVKDSEKPVEIIYTSNILFLVIDGKIHITVNGFTYSDTGVGKKSETGEGEDLDITDIERFGFVNTYVSTNQGLYSDNGTFNSLSPVLQEVDLGELKGDDDTVNTITTNSVDKIVIGISSGSYGVIENDILSQNDQSSLDTIHKILIIDDDIWLFGQDSFKVPSIDYPIRLTTGVPL